VAAAVSHPEKYSIQGWAQIPANWPDIRLRWCCEFDFVTWFSPNLKSAIQSVMLFYFPDSSKAPRDFVWPSAAEDWIKGNILGPYARHLKAFGRA
jgi:hypothetical protein